MSIHIAELQIRTAELHAPPELSNDQHTELEHATRTFIHATWDRGWRGAGMMGRFPFGGREVTVTCMALQHLGEESNEGQFVATYS